MAANCGTRGTLGVPDIAGSNTIRSAYDSGGEPRLTQMEPQHVLDDVRVLIVDDDNDTREMLRFILEQSGAEVLSAGSVPEAIEIYRTSRPGVIVADIGMPEYNGYALVALIQEHDRKMRRSTPVIALTAYTSPADRETALAAGFKRYMAKPFDPAEMIKTIRHLCNSDTD
jgi:CheY-like chemotaxis protein